MVKHRTLYTLLILLIFFFPAFLNAEAQTACFNEPLAGSWINREAVTKDLIKVEIIYQCTQEENKDGLVVPGARWYARAWAKCYPANCSWGRTEAHTDPAGNLRASFATFSADRFLQIKRIGEMISVHLIVNYHDDRRQDLNLNVQMARVAK